MPLADRSDAAPRGEGLGHPSRRPSPARPSAQSGNRGRQPTVPPTVGGGANLAGHPLVELPPDNDHPPRGAHPEDDPIPLHPEEPDLHLGPQPEALAGPSAQDEHVGAPANGPRGSRRGKAGSSTTSWRAAPPGATTKGPARLAVTWGGSPWRERKTRTASSRPT